MLTAPIRKRIMMEWRKLTLMSVHKRAKVRTQSAISQNSAELFMCLVLESKSELLKACVIHCLKPGRESKRKGLTEKRLRVAVHVPHLVSCCSCRQEEYQANKHLTRQPPRTLLQTPSSTRLAWLSYPRRMVKAARVRSDLLLCSATFAWLRANAAIRSDLETMSPTRCTPGHPARNSAKHNQWTLA